MILYGETVTVLGNFDQIEKLWLFGEILRIWRNYFLVLFANNNSVMHLKPLPPTQHSKYNGEHIYVLVYVVKPKMVLFIGAKFV